VDLINGMWRCKLNYPHTVCFPGTCNEPSGSFNIWEFIITWYILSASQEWVLSKVSKRTLYFLENFTDHKPFLNIWRKTNIWHRSLFFQANPLVYIHQCLPDRQVYTGFETTGFGYVKTNKGKGISSLLWIKVLEFDTRRKAQKK
jgi:hypothetical protein